MRAIFLPHYGDKEASRINIFIFRNVRVLFANEVKFSSYFLCVYFKFEFKIEIKFLHLSFLLFFFFLKIIEITLRSRF